MKKENNKNIIPYIRKLAISILLISIVWLTTIFNLNLKDTFIYQVAEQIMDCEFVIAIIAVFFGVIGLFYKNKSTYYSMFLKLELILGYTVYISRSITQSFYTNNKVSFIFTIVFSVSFIILFLNKDEINVDQESKNGLFDPITKFEELYPSRRHQADELIYIIKSQDNDYGYSICISSEWGAGKTSFINSVLDKLNKDYNQKKLDFKIYEVRINAMELDDTKSLINYFFVRIKEILKSNDIYVGINSEYQDLITSILGTAVNETAGSFLKNKFSDKSDYREKIKKLSSMIDREIRNGKIIIIIDDLERCKDDKIKEFLFFIKEISVLHHCVTVFSSDFNALIENSNLSAEFLEKFFNYRIDLQPIEDKDIISYSIHDNDFFNILENIEKIYKFKIDLTKNRKYFGAEAEQENERQKEERLKIEKENYAVFLKKIKNPRKIMYIYQKYRLLIQITEDQKNSNDKEYEQFLNKVNYKSQILILSLISVCDPLSYDIIEARGIYGFLNTISYNDQNSYLGFLYNVIFEEWEILQQDYITKEKMRFISCLIFSPDELPKIVNGFTSLQEEYIASIKDGRIPSSATSDEIISALFIAKFHTEDDRKALIKKALRLLAKSMNCDEYLCMISNNSLLFHMRENNDIFYAYFELVFQLKISNKEQSFNRLYFFEKDYLYLKLKNFTRFVSISSKYEIEYESIDESVLDFDGCNNMIKSYCERLIDCFKLEKDLNSQGTPIDNLKFIFNITKNYCIEKNIIDCLDIKNLSNQANEIIKCIEHLFKVEEYINSSEDDQSKKTLVFDKNFDGDYSKQFVILAEYIKSCDDSYDETQLLWKNVNNLLHNMIENCENISAKDLENVNMIIEAIHKKFNESPVPWRKMYIELQEKALSKQGNLKKT